MERRYVGTQCSVCNRFEAHGDLVIKGEAPFEKYYLRNGTFLGYGFDPVPWNRVSHVGQEPEEDDGLPKRDRSRHRDTG